jgi:hypothetical protein
VIYAASFFFFSNHVSIFIIFNLVAVFIEFRFFFFDNRLFQRSRLGTIFVVSRVRANIRGVDWEKLFAMFPLLSIAYV